MTDAHDPAQWSAGHVRGGEPTRDETPLYAAHGPSADDVTCPACGAVHLRFFACWKCRTRATLAARRALAHA